MSRRVYAGTNHQGVKQGNRGAVFRAIHALGPIARMEIAEHTGLNPGTVSRIVDELIDNGLARDTGLRSATGAGRRAADLEVVPSARYALGLDVARSAVTGAVVDLTGRVSERVVVPIPVTTTDAADAQVTEDVVERLMNSMPADERERLVGIGVGMPAPVSARTGRHLPMDHAAEWRHSELGPELERRWRLPTHVDNNANTAALAELWFGAGRGVDDFLLVNLSVGIGAGLVLSGELYRGDHDLAGEIGHVAVDINGPTCECGNVGCLHAYASVSAVLERVRTELDGGRASSLRDQPQPLTIEAVIAAARSGDPLTADILADVARYVAAAVSSIAYTVDPQLILVGRELPTAGDAFLTPFITELRQRLFPVVRDSVRIQATTVQAAPVVGAAILALRTFFDSPLSRQHA
ncbi:ROK family transcriptional regulator [Phytoactinopolyspora halotolerans]|uniref:ROK family transcriptional regulator n=1 Tax=Phytoactinopolyspora halotolerans TaxID=1981512 RepID=A0A6L9S530_9ACTN|nr:ROK family transcriptional regulator [Phytoactinopolyspora halotolerans]NEE00157.1 ROK family transcriptional regulator [Phytoactinopolyspora halotolerans]